MATVKFLMEMNPLGMALFIWTGRPVTGDTGLLSINFFLNTLYVYEMILQVAYATSASLKDINESMKRELSILFEQERR